MVTRPSYQEIVMAHLRAGYDAWERKEKSADGHAVANDLGLSVQEALDHRRSLERAGLIIVQASMTSAWFRLSPEGIAFVEILDRHTTELQAASVPEAEKNTVIARLRHKALEAVVTKGVDAALQRVPDIVTWLGTSYPWVTKVLGL